MSSREPTPRRRQIAAFIGALERLDAAGRARLKRNAGRSLGEARDVQRVFFQALPFVLARGSAEEASYFLVATLFPIADSRADGVSLGSTMRRVSRGRAREGRASASLDRRFQTLLDSRREQLPFRLRQAVRLAAASEQGVDWFRLLDDLLRWEWDDKPVQTQWARDYFVGRQDSGEGTA
ncbi:MAG: type I-E CRISPR-associated protein Cse2/CasB [Chloroflexales bacterium]|nr:type I-E CRISPR-associated protein Cse2/CasB [Chloroflexales bacterium]